MKKTFVFCFVFSILFALFACSAKHYDENNITELYDSEWIVGRAYEEIEHKYGRFDRQYVSEAGENVGAYYVNYENKGIDPSYIHDTFFVVFDDDSIAIDAYFRKTSMGG